jgi:glycosyltransferase involved in cell wall biosynthesis
MLFKDKANWLSTLPPQNPVERVDYEKWKKFCASKRINICFETGMKLSFDETMFLTDRCVCTSRKEGFGMAFLEPWTFGIPMCGRNISYVTADFKENGLALDHLYDRIEARGKDFSELAPNEQMDFISRLKRNEKIAEEFIEENSLNEKLFSGITQDMINENAEKIKRFYSLESYGERLNGIYGKMFERT